MANLIKNSRLGGLDLRTNLLTRQGNTSSDLLNCYLDSSGRLVNMPRFSTVNLVSLGLTGQIYDIVPYKRLNILVLFTRDNYDAISELWEIKLWKYNPETDELEEIKNNNYGEYVQQDVTNYSYAREFVPNLEVNNNLYFIIDAPQSSATQDYTTLQRYDGRYWNTSGMPTPRYDLTAAGTGRYARHFYFHYDENLNFVAGNYLDVEDSTATIKVSKRHAPSVSYRNFMTSSLATDRVAANLGALVTTVSGDSVIQIITHVNYVNCKVGDTVKLLTDKINRFVDAVLVGTFKQLYEFTVHSIDYTDLANVQVRLDLTSYRYYDDETQKWTNVSGTLGWTSTAVPVGYTIGNMFIAVYTSLNGVDWTFDRVDIAFSSNLDITTTLIMTPNPSTPQDTAANYPQFLEITQTYDNGFDETSFRGLSPFGKSIALYGGSILIADDNAVYISDGLTDGTSIENFRGGNQSLQAGTSKDGPITGVFGNENFISVFRERQAYYVVGDIFNNNYRTQSFYSTEIGCSSALSIAEFSGYCFFMSSRGLYLARQGATMDELSDLIEPMFTDNVLGLNLDTTNSKTQIDYFREYVFIYIGSSSGTPRVLAFSYFHKEWFMFDLDGDFGFAVFNNKIYYSDGTNFYKEDSSSLRPQQFVWRSNFETLGEPTLRKQFLQIQLFSLNNSQFELNLKTEENWIEGTYSTDEVIDLTTDLFFTKRFNSSRDFSKRISLEANTNKDIIIDGYEYEYQAPQSKLKSVNGTKI